MSNWDSRTFLVRHWTDFLHRWKKVEARSLRVNESEKLSDSTWLYEPPKKKELVEVDAVEHPKANAQERKGEYIPLNIWVEFRNRWTRDSRLKGRAEKSGDSDERKELTIVFEDRSVATFPPLTSQGFLDRGVEQSIIKDPETLTRNSNPKKTESFAEGSEEGDSENNRKEISDVKHANIKEGVPFENPLFPNGVFPPGGEILNYFVKRDSKVKANSLAPTASSVQRYLDVMNAFVDGTGDVRWTYKDGSVVRETISSKFTKEVKARAKSAQKARCQRINSYEALAKRKCRGDGVAQRRKCKLVRRNKLSKKPDASVDRLDRTVTNPQGECLTKEKQKLKNLSQLRGEEIRKQRIERREWKKKQKQADLRREVAKRLLSELRREERRIQTEKKQLRRSWKALKREKKRISLERELRKKDREDLKNFMATLKEEKQKLKRKKVKLKEKVKEMLTKERENLKLKEEALHAENKEEAERLRSEISQERNKLRRKKKELKSLKKAAEKEYKKWLREMRKVKRQEEEKRETEQAKLREEAKKKREKSARERQRKREYDSVIREQAKYDKEKRNRKDEYDDQTRGEWRKENLVKEDETSSHQSDSNKKAKQNYLGESFRKQLDDVKKWLSDVHKKALEQQRIYWPGTLLKPVFDVINGRTANSEPSEEEKPANMEDKELKQHISNSAEEKEEKENKYTNSGEDINGDKEWVEADYEKEETKKWELTVSKSEVTKVSEDKAVMGFTNLTFGIDLINILLKGFDKQKHEDKTASESGREAESRAFVIISEESADLDASGRGLNVKKKKSRQKPKHSDRKPKRPDGKLKRHDHRRHGRHRWQDRHHDSTEEIRESPQGPITAEDIRLMSENLYEHTTAQNVRYKVPPAGPTPPEGLKLSLEERYKNRFNVLKTKRKPVTPQGPTLSDDVHQAHSSKGNKRLKREHSDAQDKVCSSEVPDSHESIPPPDWLFERAKGRRDQRRAPWYVRRAEDREFQRSTDRHESQFPCGRKRQRFKGPLDPSWFFDRADDRAFQRLNNEPWYTRRTEGREAERQKGHDSWFLERGYYRSNLRDLSSWYGEHNWRMPQGPSMEEHR